MIPNLALRQIFSQGDGAQSEVISLSEIIWPHITPSIISITEELPHEAEVYWCSKDAENRRVGKCKQRLRLCGDDATLGRLDAWYLRYQSYT